MRQYKYVNKMHASANGQLNFSTAQTTVQLKAVKDSSHTIYIQRVIVFIKTDAADSITFQDDSGTPVVVGVVTSSPGVDTRWDFDYGEQGIALTTGANFEAVFSAAGLAGTIVFYGYQKGSGTN